MRSFWSRHERFWVTFNKPDAASLLAGERVYYAHHPTQRNLLNLVHNFFLARRIIQTERPSVIISTGAGVGVPFIWIGRMLSIKTVWIESITMIRSMTLSGKLVYPLAEEFLVQWPELAERYEKARFKGQVI